MPQPRLRVLIIDSDKEDHELLRRRFAEVSAWEIRPASAYDADSALAALRESMFDAAFLDFHLPDMDGIKLLEQIRQRHPKVAVIMTANKGNEKIAVDAIRRGAIDHLVRSDLNAIDFDRLMRRAMEMQALQGENAELRQVNRMKDEFIASVSHELRTPLAVILGYAKSLEDGDLGEINPPQKSAVEAIGRRGTKLLEMLNRLLAFKDASQGHQQAVLHPTDLGAFINEVLSGVIEGDHRHGAAIERRLPAEPIWILADAAQLKEVFLNLLSNAVKFSPEDSRIQVALEVHGGKEAWVKIVDEGRGIPPESLPRLFEGFYHTDTDLTREVSGLGLGLALARQTVELHGGRVWLESEGVGSGTTAYVALPLSAASASQVIVEQQRRIDKKKVLICEDNEDIIEIIRLFLANFSDNLILTTTDQGKHALELLSQTPYDLLILDLMMPGMSGFDVMERMQRMPEDRQATVLIVSGHQEAAKSAVEKGARAFILKPFSKDVFISKVLELLGLERRGKKRAGV
ncbi:MAG: response regulator [Elusimicrobiota bacterium]